MLALLCALPAAVGGVGACTTAQPVDEGALAALQEQDGGFLTGAPVGLGAPDVVNRRDFIYAVAFGADDVVAFVHHVTTNMELTATQVAPLRPRFQQPVNPTQFDVEDVVILDAGSGKGTIVVPSRQGTVRAFDAMTGASVRELITGVALVRAAISPDGGVLALGGADGRVFLLDAATFGVRGEARLHDDEIRGLAFLPDGRIVTSSFDGKLHVSALSPGGEPLVRAAAAALKTGERVFLAHIDGARAIATVRDVRQPSNIVTSAAVKRLGLAPTPDGAMLPVVTAAGNADMPAVSLGRVQLHTLDLGAFTAAVCDACVPPGAEMVLGAPALARASFVDDIARDEILVKPAEGEGAARLIDTALSVAVTKTVALPGPATDVDVSRAGQVLVSFSHAKAERSFDLYEAEKKGEYPPVSAASGAALVDVNAGTLGKTFAGHRGFTTTAAISPDGRTVATGGWDKRVIVWDARTGEQVTERELAWLLRRVRFSPNGRLLGVAAWTPVNAFNEGNSEPSLLLYPLTLEGTAVAGK